MWPEEGIFHELRRHLIEQRGIAWDAEGAKSSSTLITILGILTFCKILKR